MREDIEAEVVHDAAVLLRNRRGANPIRAVVRQSARAVIRHVPRDAFAPAPSVTGENAGINGGLTVFEGRLWRPVCGVAPWGSNRIPSRNSTVASVINALANPPVVGIRDDLWQLGLTPWNVRNHYGRTAEHGQVIAAETVVPSKLALDLRAEAAGAISRRVSDNLAHDGTMAWVAMPTPLLRYSGSPGCYVVEPPIRDKFSFHPHSLAEHTEGYVEYLRRSEHANSFTNPAAQRVLEAGRRLASELSGIEATPMADVLRNVRRLAHLTHLSATSLASGTTPEVEETITGLVEGLLPLVTRASADLLAERDLPDAVDRIASVSARTLELREKRAGESSHNVHALRRVLAYVEAVARPRLSAGNVPEADAESLGALVW
jgi:hypothetical protein